LWYFPSVVCSTADQKNEISAVAGSEEDEWRGEEKTRRGKPVGREISALIDHTHTRID